MSKNGFGPLHFEGGRTITTFGVNISRLIEIVFERFIALTV